ncbi:DUF6308 family protein, partial [Streptomyces bobili]|uniref:DUF6308 family protein n=1 Tax=Streptomyces bobili TaxID=67280 RepID=UPI001FCA2F68
MACRRPRLLPVYDRVVRCAVGRRPSFWLALHTALCEDGAALHRQLLELRRAAGLPETVSALRMCDVAVWMNHRALGHPCPWGCQPSTRPEGGVLACEGDGLYQPSPGCVGRSCGVVRRCGGGEWTRARRAADGAALGLEGA